MVLFLCNFFLAFWLSTQYIVNSAEFEPLKPSENYGLNQVIIDQDEQNNVIYLFNWKLLPNDEILFEVHAKNLGWVGIGISMSCGMRGADIAIGWVDSNGTTNLRVFIY